MAHSGSENNLLAIRREERIVIRAGLIDGTPVTSLLGDVWPLAVMGAVLIPFGLWAFGRAERYAKRTGKLKRVG